MLVAQDNYWRTGWYDDNGTYHPNTNEERFLRCPNTACLGGVDSQCRTGTGPYCSECQGTDVFNLFILRCDDCNWGAGHFFAWMGWLVVQLVVMVVLVDTSFKRLGKNLTDFDTVSRILINWGQQLGLILQVSVALVCFRWTEGWCAFVAVPRGRVGAWHRACYVARAWDGVWHVTRARQCTAKRCYSRLYMRGAA